MGILWGIIKESGDGFYIKCLLSQCIDSIVLYIYIYKYIYIYICNLSTPLLEFQQKNVYEKSYEVMNYAKHFLFVEGRCFLIG